MMRPPLTRERSGDKGKPDPAPSSSSKEKLQNPLQKEKDMPGIIFKRSKAATSSFDDANHQQKKRKKPSPKRRK
jgi:hypothetical protein